LGALIGFFIGLVGELLKRGWLMVVRSQSRNAREGREYPLVKPVTIIGRAEESDIGLFGDQSVLGHHAIVRREGKNFFVSGTGGGRVLVNRQPVNGRQALKSGDRIEVGGTLFLFRERHQAAGR
ncbi:MAG TPA: FHA domain-containing protein, partial [Candidatus Binataceae bacterium]|nr:FHA domain-containing protein [Candidatus Binataceae bacterium]